MAMYQFLIAVRAAGQSGVAYTLTNQHGEETSHLQGFFYRTIAMYKAGIKPVYVFDGKPPRLKSGELASRSQRRADGERRLKEAEEAGDVDEMNKQSKRTTKGNYPPRRLGRQLQLPQQPPKPPSHPDPHHSPSVLMTR